MYLLFASRIFSDALLFIRLRTKKKQKKKTVKYTLLLASVYTDIKFCVASPLAFQYCMHAEKLGMDTMLRYW